MFVCRSYGYCILDEIGKCDWDVEQLGYHQAFELMSTLSTGKYVGNVVL